MYLTLRPPWAREATTPPEPVAAPPDAGIRDKGKPKRRPVRRPGAPAAADTAATDDDELAPPKPLTAAERRPESRGDAVALPAAKLDLSSNAEARSLTDGEISAVLANQSSAARQCVVASATDTDLSATIEVQLLVDATGRVTKSRLEGAPRYLFEHGLLECARRALGGLRFPATGAPTLVKFPIHLGAG